MEEVIGINYLCLYAMLEMILKDIGITGWDQIRLANQFGVVLPVDDRISGVKNVTYSTDEHMCGTHINADSLNAFFVMKKIPLRASYLSANPFNCYDEIEKEGLEKYIVYLYSYGSLNDDQSKRHIGHASIKVNDIKEGMVSIYDPGPLNAGVKTIRLNKLYDAINDYNGGILIFERV